MKRKNTRKNMNYSLAHVLYQKLGNDWYAFTEVDGDCFMTKVSADVAVAKNAISQSHEEHKHARKRRAA